MIGAMCEQYETERDKFGVDYQDSERNSSRTKHMEDLDMKSVNTLKFNKLICLTH